MDSRARAATLAAHLILVVLLLGAVPGMQRCSGDFIGSCLTFLIPPLLLVVVVILAGLYRWSSGRVGVLVAGDVLALLLGVLGEAASGGTGFVVIGSFVALVMLVVAEGSGQQQSR